MPLSPRPTPRRAPVQERSRALVQRIIDAGYRVLLTHGYEGASTNRIADEAEVSSGSLYQYFSNKDEIIAAVVEQYTETLQTRIAKALTTRLDEPPAILTRATLEALLDALADQPEFLRVVVEQTPRLDGGARIGRFEERIAELTGAYLRFNRRRLRDAPMDTAAWILVQTVEQVTIRYVLDKPPIERDEFLDELTTLAINYLKLA